MNMFRTWFGQQSRRDQAALAVLALALVLYLLVTALIRPLQQSLQESQARLLAAEQSLEHVKSLAARLATLQQGSAAPASPDGIALRVDASAALAGVQILNMEPAADGNSVAIRVDGLTLAVLMQWLQQLAADSIAVESLVLLPSRTESLLSANLRLVNSI
jgi:type II secretory pathway component PulM